MAEGDLVQIGEIEVGRAEITKKRISEIEYPRPAIIAAIVRSGKTFVPDGNESLRLGDRIYVLTERNGLDSIGKMFSLPRKPIQNVIIAGGGTVGFFVASQLEQLGIHVKIIEQDKERCTEISKRLDRTLVIQGEVTSVEYLRDEGVHSADAFIAAVDRDELNILISVLAKNLGTARSIAVVNRPEYIPLAEGIGVDIVVSPLILANSAFDRFIHQPHVLSAAAFARGEAEAIEIPIEDRAPAIGPSLGKLELPKNTRIGAIIREGKVLIPKPEDFVFAGDRVILVGLRTALPLAEKFFQSK
jgi:trk system potassium uptake protein TrkA